MIYMYISLNHIYIREYTYSIVEGLKVTFGGRRHETEGCGLWCPPLEVPSGIGVRGPGSSRWQLFRLWFPLPRECLSLASRGTGPSSLVSHTVVRSEVSAALGSALALGRHSLLQTHFLDQVKDCAHICSC